MDAIEAGVRIALQAVGCHDVDVAVKLGAAAGVKLTAAGSVEPSSVAAAVGAFRAAKPYLFGSGTSSAAKEPAKSALDMTPEEYRAAKWRLACEAEQHRRESMAPNFTKSALEMDDAEYQEFRRRKQGSYSRISSTGAGNGIAKLMEGRGNQRQPERTWGAKFLAERKVKLYP
jgi:hypothetical protein